MRDLTNIELHTVSGAAMPAPVRPSGPTTLFGVRLSKKDQAVLGALIRLVARPLPRR